MNQMSTPFSIALIQEAPVFLNSAASLERARDLVQQAASDGARLMVFPESWLPGYPLWLDHAPGAAQWGNQGALDLYRLLQENSLSLPSLELTLLCDLAASLRVFIVMGIHERRGGTLYNSMLYIDDKGDYRLHRKLMPTYNEKLIWGQGDGSTLGIMNTPFGAMGGLICWEHWMPLARAAMHAQGETIHIAQWPAVIDLHQLASRHYAFEGQCFVLAVGCVLSRNQLLADVSAQKGVSKAALNMLESMVPPADDLLLRGGSAIIKPDSSYLTLPLFDQAAIIHAELQPELIKQGQLLMDSNGHYARPDVFQLCINQKAQESVVFSDLEGLHDDA